MGFYPWWLCCSNWESKESECLCIVSGKNQLRVLLGSQGQQVPVLRDVWDNPLYQDLQELPVVNERLSLAFCPDISFIIYCLIRKLHKIQHNNTYGHYLFAKEVNWRTHTHTKQDSHSSGQGGRIRSLAERWVIQERDRTLRLWSPARPLWTYIIFFKDLSLMLAHGTHACSMGLIPQMREDHNPIHGQINESKLYFCTWAVSP